MKPKLLQSKPYKVYLINISNENELKALCDFSNKQPDKKLDLLINNKKYSFNSKIGRKKFIDGLQAASKLSTTFSNKTSSQKASCLNTKLQIIMSQKAEADKKYKDFSDKYRIRYELYRIREAAWKDRLAELEDDRAILKKEIERLRKK